MSEARATEEKPWDMEIIFFMARKATSQYYVPALGHSLSDLFSEIQSVNRNIDSKFNSLQIQLTTSRKR